MLRLQEPNKELKLPEMDDFVINHGRPKRLLPHFKDSLSGVKSNTFQFDINILKESFREFAWLFVRVIDRESTTYFPWYVLFVLSGTFRMSWNFDWAISNEISHQLSNYQQTKRFFMTAYLVYAIIYNCTMK